MPCTAAAPCCAARSAIRPTSDTAGFTTASPWRTARGASRRAATSNSAPWIGGWTQETSSALRKTRPQEKRSTPTTPPSISSVSVEFQAIFPSFDGGNKTTLLSENYQLTGFHNGNKGVHPVSGSKKPNKSCSIRWRGSVSWRNVSTLLPYSSWLLLSIGNWICVPPSMCFFVACLSSPLCNTLFPIYSQRAFCQEITEQSSSP